MNEELFTLCKRVYEATGWDDMIDYFYTKANGDYNVQRANHIQVNHNWWKIDGEVPNGSYPLYTSDYLLEKLPAYIQSKVYPKKRASLEMEKDGVDGGTPTYFFWYIVHEEDQSDLGVHSDTPLKALLKLTITLSEAGELK